MPFGDRIDTRLAKVKRADYSPGLQQMPSRRVHVPEVDPPWWWSEYLTDEWKRRNHYQQQPRDGRSQWQRSRDEWGKQLRRWELEDFGLLGNKPSLTKAPHSLWGDAPHVSSS